MREETKSIAGWKIFMCARLCVVDAPNPPANSVEMSPVNGQQLTSSPSTPQLFCLRDFPGALITFFYLYARKPRTLLGAALNHGGMELSW